MRARSALIATPFLVAALVVAPSVASAHVGSPDVVHDGLAGPYRLLVSVRPPQVIPGVAEVEVDSPDADLAEVKLVPMPLGGDGARFAPTPDVARPVEGTHTTYLGRLWMMSAGPWQVRVTAAGARGQGVLAVPVPALPSRTAGMQSTMAVILVALMLFLSLSLVWIVWAAVAEAELPAGARPDTATQRRARRAGVVAAALTLASLLFGRAWWNLEAAAYDRYVYKPLEADVTVDEHALTLSLRDPGWLKTRRLDDLVPDHDHLMHLFMVRVPELDRIYHLHPVARSEDRFIHDLPDDAPPGRYALFADVVHADGLAETATAQIAVPAHQPEKAGSPPIAHFTDPDDGEGLAPPIAEADPSRKISPLSVGQMVFLHDPGSLRSDHVERLRFRVEDAGGAPTPDLELYMGMLGHAAILRDDLTVFAHIHPSGSVPMPSLALAEAMVADDAATAAAAGTASTVAMKTHAGHEMQHGMNHDMHAGMHHDMNQGALPSEVSFPYRFPRPGDYRIFVQIKRRGRIETGAFDVKVD